MKITKENVSRKMDSLGRISIPKAMRQRLNIEDLSELEFYTFEDEVTGESYIAMTNHISNNSRYESAAAVLSELGVDIPEELAKKL